MASHVAQIVDGIDDACVKQEQVHSYNAAVAIVQAAVRTVHPFGEVMLMEAEVGVKAEPGVPAEDVKKLSEANDRLQRLIDRAEVSAAQFVRAIAGLRSAKRNTEQERDSVYGEISRAWTGLRAQRTAATAEDLRNALVALNRQRWERRLALP